MWDRSVLKANAKAALRERYWNAFLVCVLASVIGGDFMDVVIRRDWDYNKIILDPFGYGMSVARAYEPLQILLLLFGVFVGIPLAVGLARYFVRNHFAAADTGTLFSGFRYGYMNSIGAVFVTRIFIGLWYLLLVIPGVVKTLEYSMVGFLLSDNPELPGGRAREISRMMTSGEKGSIFVLWLSFFGWYFLAALAGGFIAPANPYLGSLVSAAAALFIVPYYNATMAELYLFLRDRGIRSGMIHPAELGLSVPEPVPSAT